jgi:nucleoside-diphosphate-sugar epimerase
MLPRDPRYQDKKIQFVHVDDVARLLVHILGLVEPETQRLNILNVAGRGEPLTYRQCIQLAHAKLLRMPGVWSCKMVLEALWRSGISAIPPEAVPYMTGEYLMDTSNLQNWLGDKYPEIIQYTIERLGFSLNDFYGVRVQLNYPPIPTMLMYRYPLPEV